MRAAFLLSPSDLSVDSVALSVLATVAYGRLSNIRRVSSRCGAARRVTSSNAIVTMSMHKTPIALTPCFLFAMQRFLCLSAFLASFLAFRMATAEETTFRKPSFCHGLDCPIYTVVEETSDYEVRKYPACVFSFTHLDLYLIAVSFSQMGFDHDRQRSFRQGSADGLPCTIPLSKDTPHEIGVRRDCSITSVARMRVAQRFQ